MAGQSGKEIGGGAERWERLLRLLLRIGGLLMLLALVAVFMPRSWMVRTHEWVGLGAFPEAPIAEYLARLTSGLYALVGAIVLFVARDVRRYAALITFLAVATFLLAAGVALGSIGTGMPVEWLLGDPVAGLLFCGGILLFQHLAHRAGGQAAPENGPRE